jgi:hypothetical protein
MRVHFNIKDLTGRTFGKLVVLALIPREERPNDKDQRAYYRCRCLTCGDSIIASGANIKKNKKGCEACKNQWLGTASSHPTHGKSKANIYQTYRGILKRCHNPNNPMFYLYGGRGIKVCDRWRESFQNFYADMGDKPHGCSIERIDNDGDYSPENCKWATPREQAANRRSTKLIIHNGREMTAREASEKFGFKPYWIGNRSSEKKCSFQEAFEYYLNKQGANQ